MGQSFQAVFEHGILRPLETIRLNEDEVVSLTIVGQGASPVAEPDHDKRRALRQRDRILAFVAKMESQHDDNPHDGFSNRDHDRLIYGP